MKLPLKSILTLVYILLSTSIECMEQAPVWSSSRGPMVCCAYDATLCFVQDSNLVIQQQAKTYKPSLAYQGKAVPASIITALAINKPQNALAVGTNKGDLYLYDIATQKIFERWGTLENPLTAISFDHETNLIALGSASGLVYLYAINNKKAIPLLKQSQAIEKIVVSSARQCALASTKAPTLHDKAEPTLWDLRISDIAYGFPQGVSVGTDSSFTKLLLSTHAGEIQEVTPPSSSTTLMEWINQKKIYIAHAIIPTTKTELLVHKIPQTTSMLVRTADSPSIGIISQPLLDNYHYVGSLNTQDLVIAASNYLLKIPIAWQK